MNAALPLRYLSCLILGMLLLLPMESSQAVNLIIRKDTNAAPKKPDNKQVEERLLKKGNSKQAVQHSFAIGDLVITTDETQFRRSRAINSYNIIRMLSYNEIVTINNLQGSWVQVQTEGDEFGWVLAQKLQKVKSRTIITKDWTELIGSSISPIRACTAALQGRKPEIQTPRIIHIDPNFNTTTLTLFWDQERSKGYRCTIGVYGGEVQRLQAFNRPDVKPDTMFSSTPGRPSADSCYSNEIIFDRFRRTLGWMSYRIC